jgi:prepilin peptidase CpaA
MTQPALLMFPAVMAYAAASDLFTMKIPNWLTGVLIVTFPFFALLVGFGWPAIAMHLGAGVIFLVAGMGMFAAGWMGGGDAKLLAGIALWFGFQPALIDFLMLAALAGGVLTISLLLVRRIPMLPAFTLSWSWLHRLHDRKTGIPYGIALATGALAAYPSSTVARLLLS